MLMALFRNAVMTLDDLRACVTAFLPDIDITQTAIPFAAVAADLNTGEQVVLARGPIIPAVMASCAIPGFMPPVHLDGKILVDGGIVNMLPADVARKAGVDVVVAVDAGMSLCQPLRIEDGIDIINRCSEIMGIRLGQIARRHSDVVVQLDNGAVPWMHFRECKKLIQEGQKGAELAIDRIKQAVAPPIYRRLWSRLSRRPAADA